MRRMQPLIVHYSCNTTLPDASRLFTEASADEHAECRERGVADLVIDVQPLLASVEKPFAGHQAEVLANIRLPVTGRFHQFADGELTVDLHLVEKLQSHGFAEDLKPLRRPLDLRLRDEFFAHEIGGYGRRK